MTRTCPDCGYRIDHANAGHVEGCRGALAAPVAAPAPPALRLVRQEPAAPVLDPSPPSR
jgi:hypothetical protein